MEDKDIEEEYNLEIILSQRNQKIIIQDNKYIFYYSHTRKDNAKVYKCSENKYKKACFAYIILDSNNKYNQIDNNLSHTDHDQKLKEIQSIKEVNQMKNIIKNSNDKFTLKPIQINKQITENLETINPKYNNIRQNIYNHIKKNIPQDPKSIYENRREDPKYLNDKGDNILIYKDLNILVFTTKEAVSIAFENNNDIFLDSTFKTVCSLYKQLLIMRIYSEKFNEFFTICFILMTSKTKLLYKRALNVFLNFYKKNNKLRDNEIFFKFSHSDMEEALIKAIEETFIGTEIKLCYFHLSQVIMHRINNNVYKELFERIASSKSLILSCKALSFIKPEFVNFVFYRLKEDVDDIDDDALTDFYNYFEKEYILNYDANMWNYYLQKKHFTNNACEGYNSRLLKLTDYKKPSFWFNIHIIKNELEYFAKRYYELISNDSQPGTNPISQINRIHNLSVNNSINFNSLRIRYEHEIDDLNKAIDYGDVDDDTFQIYIEYWYEKVKILSSYL